MNLKQAAAILGKKGGESGTGACKRRTPEYYRRIGQKWRDENLKPIPERFWGKVNKNGPNGCWLFTGGRNKFGYGKFSIKDVSTNAHRVSWELVKGPIPKGLSVLHDCPGGDNPACVNPAHLFLGTHTDNMRDASKKNRFDTRGEKNGRAKLTESQVLEIRKRFPGRIKYGHLPILAREFGASPDMINQIRTRRTWVHI